MCEFLAKLSQGFNSKKCNFHNYYTVTRIQLSGQSNERCLLKIQPPPPAFLGRALSPAYWLPLTCSLLPLTQCCATGSCLKGNTTKFCLWVWATKHGQEGKSRAEIHLQSKMKIHPATCSPHLLH